MNMRENGSKQTNLEATLFYYHTHPQPKFSYLPQHPQRIVFGGERTLQVNIIGQDNMEKRIGSVREININIIV